MKIGKIVLGLVFLLLLTASVFAVKQGEVVDISNMIAVNNVKKIVDDGIANAKEEVKNEVRQELVDNIADFKKFGIELLNALKYNIRNYTILILVGSIAVLISIEALLNYIRIRAETKVLSKLEEKIDAIQKQIKEGKK